MQESQTFSLRIRSAIERGRNTIAWESYRYIRDCATRMMEEAEDRAAIPSCYWQEELSGFAYMFDASPLIIQNLREHTYHITGLRSYEYRAHHGHAGTRFAGKLEALRAIDTNGLFIPEAKELGGFGHNIDGHKVNLDTLKFYESLIAMDKAGILGAWSRERLNVLEIGGGWGGFAYQFKTLFPASTYIIVDLPPTMIFSYTYLRACFPKARFMVWGEPGFRRESIRLDDYDFVFVPHYLFPDLELPAIDIAVNMVSFQEMTTGQVSNYLAKLRESGCPVVYSHNRDRSRHNDELDAVSTCLSRYYDIEEIEVLPVSYTSLNVPNEQRYARRAEASNPLTLLRECARKYLRADATRSGGEKSLYEYRHLVGRI